jgi:hypothetical protein
MADATYVAFVPSKKRDRLREMLETEDTGELVWRERRSLFGSEFYFSGPPALARRAQAFVAQWVING